MSPSRRRTAKDLLPEADLLWLALLAYSKAASSRDQGSLTTLVLSLDEHLEARGRRLVHDGRGEAGELAPVMQETLGENNILIKGEDGQAFALIELT